MLTVAIIGPNIASLLALIEYQQGVPVAVYQGNKVNVIVSEDVPRMTLLSIDNKALYIHRANYVIYIFN